MSARDELPPGYFTRDGYIWRQNPGQNPEEQHTDRPDRYPVAWMRWETASSITREVYTTMRAAVERCAELEAALVMVRRAYEIEKSGLLSDTPTEGE